VIILSVFAPRRLATTAQTLAAPEISGLWQPWSEEAVSRSLAAGQPVFVDFTASWCLSCQVNERAALGRTEVVKAFQERNVVLMKADWTRHDEAITQALTALGRSGVPAYALFVPGENSPRLLPEVLTPGIVTDAVSKLPMQKR
jgi:thiol:disulfide interchange protein DsbD